MKLSMFMLLFSSFALAQTEIIQAPVDHLYVPTGFDSNDSVEVVVTGTFPNPCYSRNNVEVKVVADKININVSAIAPERAMVGERACPQMVVPFKEVVSVGNLQGGEYDIKVNENAADQLSDKIIISEASSNSIDDNLYAAIDYVEKKSANEVVLHGWRYSNCVELQEVKTVSNNKDTLSILPIMKQTREDCPMKGMPIALPVKVDTSSLKISKPLLHVRTMDGKSVNAIVNFEERK